MKPLRIAIIGFGKIAEDQHHPSIDADERFELAATVDTRSSGIKGVPSFRRYDEMLDAVDALDAVAICTPAAVRHGIARDCITAGLHVLLEKPPGVTVGEVEDLATLASREHTTLFTTWHSQYNPGVDAATEALAGQRVESMRIVWHEDVRKWHPGQEWIWEPGGFGVFDPGINALAIATRVIPDGLFVRDAELLVPSNKTMPIAARLRLARQSAVGDLSADFDWRERGDDRWTIEIKTSDGTSLLLSEGGASLSINGTRTVSEEAHEYSRIYQRFADLIGERHSLIELAPLRLVADAFLVGSRVATEAFQTA